MLRRLPVIPTLLVLLAVGVMVRLGFWQFDRMHQKEALLASYQANDGQAELVDALEPLFERQKHYYRKTEIICWSRAQTRPRAGQNAKGEIGWSQWANCWAWDHVHFANVNLGWTKDPKPIRFEDGKIVGTIIPDDKQGMRIVADPPLAGLEANAKPDPANIPNNHLSYAIQWFLFALTALVIYAIALRKRLKQG